MGSQGRTFIISKAEYRTQSPDQTSHVIHPAYSLLQRPELARHVRHVRETGRVFSPLLTEHANSGLGRVLGA
jgi:hypothetical protein